MKKILIAIWDGITALGKATHAANLSRNGQWRRAKEMYK